MNKTVRAAYDGVIKTIYDAGNGWGTGITMEHIDTNGNKVTTNYTHIIPNEKIKKNKAVKKGAAIAKVANLTRSNPHLHYSIRRAPYSKYSNAGALPVVNQEDCKCTYYNPKKYNRPVFPEYFIDPSIASYSSP